MERLEAIVNERVNFQKDFAESAKAVLMFGREEALKLGHSYIGSEHLLLGLLRLSDDDPTKQELSKAGLSLNVVQHYVHSHFGLEKIGVLRCLKQPDLHLTERSKRIILTAAREFIRHLDLHSPISKINLQLESLHLLWALLKEEEGVAAAVFKHHKIDTGKFRRRILFDSRSRLDGVTPLLRMLNNVFLNPNASWDTLLELGAKIEETHISLENQ